jgi:hypothetical protein
LCSPVCKVKKDQSDTVSKAADPGKYKDKRKWPEKEPASVLSTIPGVNGIPLRYVIRELEHPNRSAIACTPLTGSNFQADSRKAHQLLKCFLQAQSAEQWIKPLARHQDGTKDMKALKGHYSGEGSTSRCIAVAERYRETLHYKDKKALSSSVFLGKIETMFNIIETEGEPVTEKAKVRMLLKKVEHPHLQTAVRTLRVRAQMYKDKVTFTECAKHLSALVSEWPDYQLKCKVSAVDTKVRTKRIRGGGQPAPYCLASKRKGIFMPDVSVWTGYYSDWEKMSDVESSRLSWTPGNTKQKSQPQPK